MLDKTFDLFLVNIAFALSTKNYSLLSLSGYQVPVFYWSPACVDHKSKYLGTGTLRDFYPFVASFIMESAFQKINAGTKVDSVEES